MTTYIYEHQWVYYIAPLIGIIIGGLFYKAHNITSLISDNFENPVVLKDDMTQANNGESRRGSQSGF